MVEKLCVVAVEGATYSFDIPYSYVLGEHTAVVGSFCMVPFGRGKRPRVGVILGFDEGDSEGLKAVMAVADTTHALTEEQLELCEFVKEQYICSFFDAVRVIIPSPFLYKTDTKTNVTRLVRRRKTEPKTIIPVQPKLMKALTLSQQQQKVYDEIHPLADAPDGKPALLYGVTASGKTAVFIKLIERVTLLGKSVLLLLPEISLASQMAQRMIELFGESVAVVHSGLKDGDRAIAYKGIESGAYKIIVGTRTAVFSPVKNLGLIIIDEEQDSSYRSEQTPRFSAVAVASYRAKTCNALLLLASATPSITSFYYAKTGRFHLFELNTRYNNLPLPKAQLCDLRSQRESGSVSSISSYLASEIDENLRNNEQSILLLNRRGYRTVGLCKECRTVKTCGSCSVPMVLHLSKNKLLCHYCATSENPSIARCAECGGELSYSGFGTEHIEQELSLRFPNAGILRIDTDSVSIKNSHGELLDKFKEHKADILVGTQMVAKGLDFEKVTLVGVLSIDSMLYADSYRTFETVFSLVTQVVGRSGRKSGIGRAIIETYNPDHWVLKLAAEQDYISFYEKELKMREIALYPPFCSLVIVSIVSISESRALAAAGNLKAILQRFHRLPHNKDIPLRLLGPASYTVATIAGKNRVKLTIKCRNSLRFRNFLRKALKQLTLDKADSGVTITVDFNSQED